MAFKVDDQVVYTACGIGRVVALVTKRFNEAEARQYYEVEIDKGTVWVSVDAGPGSGLRRLTRRSELARYREVLRGQPGPLSPDARQRRLDLATRLRAGSFLATCEVVRDLTGLSWRKTLNEADIMALRRAQEELCQEWAAAAAVPLADAIEEVNGLLGQSREAHGSLPTV